jgi:hypothetical protein
MSGEPGGADMEARAFEAALRTWHAIGLPPRLAAAIARQATAYARITAATGLAFDDEPAVFVRVREAGARESRS